MNKSFLPFFLVSTVFITNTYALNLAKTNFSVDIINTSNNTNPLEVAYTSNDATYLVFDHDLADKTPALLFKNSDSNQVIYGAVTGNLLTLRPATQELKLYDAISDELLAVAKFRSRLNINDIVPSPSFIMSEFNGYYFNTSIGVSSIDNHDPKGLFYQLTLGYQFNVGGNWLLGTQISYQDYGSYSVSDDNLGSKNYNAAFNIKFIANSGLTSAFKIGVARVDSKGSSVLENDVSFSPAVGASIGYQVNNYFAINTNYDHVFQSNKSLSSDAISIGLEYNL